MDSVVQKISSYNILNYLLPGIIFVVLTETITKYSFTHDDILISLFLYYFIGMVVSRIGSLFLEPVAKKLKIIKFVDYLSFSKAVNKESKLEALSEANNIYRSLLIAFILVFFLKFYELLGSVVPFFEEQSIYLLMIALVLIFLFSYRKQTNYVVKRVGALLKNDSIIK